MSAGIMADVEEGPKVVEDSQLALKTRVPTISFGGLHCDINIFLIRGRFLPFRQKSDGYPEGDGVASWRAGSTISRDEDLKHECCVHLSPKIATTLYAQGVLLGRVHGLYCSMRSAT